MRNKIPALALVLLLVNSPSLLFFNFPISLQSITNQSQIQAGDVKKRFIAWKQLIVNNIHKDSEEKLKIVNDFFNQFEYIPDQEEKGQEDYWKTPDEFVRDGGGDCEDFAIAKYF